MTEPDTCTCSWGTVNAGYVHGIGSSAEYVGPIQVRLTTDPVCPKHGTQQKASPDE